LVAVLDSSPILDVLKQQVQSVSAIEKIGTSETTGVEGVNLSVKLHLDNGKSYLFKPQYGEHVSSWRYIPPKQLYLREKAAYIIDCILGFNMVPQVRIARYHGKVGSLQYWVEDASPSDATLKTYSSEDIWKAGLFDIIIGQTDRHSGNFLTKLNKPILIDNGFAFPSYASSESKRSLILSRFAYAIFDKPITRELCRVIDRLNADYVKKRLSRYLGKKSLGLMYERLNEMIDRGKASCHKYKVIRKLEHVPKDEIKANIIKNIYRLGGFSVYYL
jgi:hypothetical protein